ncbi:hypothetical protein EX895_000359 [Sporisorium graminicola]|uniref:cellulase n=1 Tax=Sporisorium graminicola TaxID=280036 RepID=A0A4U7KZL6_9BASI|nr:hypothetical protein EX895_000359 [Sporisorium graminicola]TKY90361.1 hypothetical protein EX895_000359 [Sporisorium graminicola]
MGAEFKSTFAVILAAIASSQFIATSNAYNPPNGPFATRFWDCCPAAFAWSRPSAGLYAPVDMCQKDGVTPISTQEKVSGKNGCDDGGNQFACNCIQPWLDTVDPELGYGFGAYNIHDPDGTIENTCWYVEFQPQDPNGKALKVRKMILQNINTSQGISKGSWDLNLAGGGVGDFPKGCANQWETSWGQQYGGVDNEQACCKLPEGLRSSCLFRFKMFGDNPGLASTPKRVRCPVGIIDRSGAQRQDDATVAPYSGQTDQTGYPAPDKYQRNRSVCQNVDPLGIVSSVCSGSGEGARLPKGYGMVRQDSPGAKVPDEAGSPDPSTGFPTFPAQPPTDTQAESYGRAHGPIELGHGGDDAGLGGGAGSGFRPGADAGAEAHVGAGAGPGDRSGSVPGPGAATNSPRFGPPSPPQGPVSIDKPADKAGPPARPARASTGLAGHRRSTCRRGKHD